MGMSIQEAIEAFAKNYYGEMRRQMFERAKRKARLSYKMKPNQARVYSRIKHRGGISQIEYLGEDWRTTNSMFSRGWLMWEERRGKLYVVAGYGKSEATLSVVR